MEALDLRALIIQCRKGDRAAQKQLYMRYYSYGMGICVRYVTNKDEALSCFNDAFLKAFNNLEVFDTSRDFKPWIKTILVNTLLNHLRKANKLKESDLETAIEVGQNEITTSKLQYEDLLALVQSLSEHYKLVFNMYVIDGYTHEEIAQKLNINVSTSRSNLARAKARLRQLLTTAIPLEYEE